MPWTPPEVSKKQDGFIPPEVKKKSEGSVDSTTDSSEPVKQESKPLEQTSDKYQIPSATEIDSGLTDQADPTKKVEAEVKVELQPPTAEYGVNGDLIDRKTIKDNLFDRDFIEGVREGKINVSIKDDPELEQLLQRQVESGSEWGDKLEYLESGAYKLAAGALGAQNYLANVLEEVTGVPFSENPEAVVSKVMSEDMAKKAEESVEKTRAYDGGFYDSLTSGNFMDAANIMGNSLSETAPLIAATAITGGSVSGSAAMLSSVLIPSEYASENISEDEKIKELSNQKKLIRAFLYGGAEGLGEAVTGGIAGNSFKLFKSGLKRTINNTAKEIGTEGAEQLAKATADKTAKDILKAYGIDIAKEGGSEMFTQLSQDLTDDLMGVRDLTLEDYLVNMREAGTMGVFMGGAMGSVGVTGQGLSMLRDNKLYENSIKSVDESVKNGELDPQEAEALKKDITVSKEAIDGTDPELSEENQIKTAELRKEKINLEEKIEGLDENQPSVQSKKERIEKINSEIGSLGEMTNEQLSEQAKVNEEASKEQLKDDIAEETELEEKAIGEDEAKLKAVKQDVREDLAKESISPEEYTEKLHQVELLEAQEETDLDKIHRLYSKELESSQSSKAESQVWLSEFLNSKVNKDSFERWADKNKITSGMAKTWFAPKYTKPISKDAVGGRRKIEPDAEKSLENISKNILANYGINVSPSELAEIMIENPNGARVTTEGSNLMKARYRELTGKSIDNHNENVKLKKKYREQPKQETKKTPVKEKTGESTKKTDVKPNEKETTQKPVVEKVSKQDTEKRKDNAKSVDAEKVKEKTIAKKRAYDGDIREGVKKELESLGLTREIESQKEAKKKAVDFVGKVGDETALDAVRSGDVEGAAAAYIYNQVIENLDEKIAKSKNTEETSELEKQQAEILQEFSEKALEGGRFSSALNDIYQTSVLGYNVERKISQYKKENGGEIPKEVEQKFRELDKELQDLKKKLAEAKEKEAKRADDDLIRNIIEAADRENTSKRRKAYVKKAISSIKDLRKNIKANNYSDATGMVAIIDSGLLTIEKALTAGLELTEAVEKGVTYIKTKLKEKGVDNWDKESNFRNDVNNTFKDSGLEPSNVSINEDGKLHIPIKLLKDLIKEGNADIESLTKAVLDIVNEDYPNVTLREVRDAITGYGKTRNLNKDEVSKQLSKAKRIGRIISALEDIKEKKRPLKSGAQRERMDAEERSKLKELREAMKELPEDLEENERQLKTALESEKQRLRNKIEDLQREIDKREQVKRSPKVRKSDSELEKLKEERDKLKEKHDSIFKNEAFRNKKRLEIAKRNAAKKINDLQNRLRTRDFSKKKTPPRVSDSELTKLKAEVLRVQEAYDKEFYKNKLLRRSAAEIRGDLLWDAWGLFRALRATGEFSFILIQGLTQTVSHPIYAAKALKRALKFFASESKTEKWLREIKSQDWYYELEKSKLALTEIHAEVTVREELFYSDWITTIWDNIITKPARILGKSAHEKAKQASPFKAIERASVGFLDTMRVMRFLDGKEMLEEQGITFDSNPEAYKQMADAINTMTGRASLGALEQNSKQLTKFFFSPRNWASVVKTATPYAFYHFGKMRAGAKGWKPSVAQKMAISDFSKFVGLTASMVSMFALALNNDDDDETGVELDPRSSDFGKIKIGNTRIDPWGGRIQQIVFTARMLSESVVKNGKEIKLGTPFQAPSRFELMQQQATNKLAPSAQMVFKYLNTHIDKNGNRKTAWGEDYDKLDELKNNLYPIYAETIKELAEDGVSPLDGLLIFYAFLGGGVSVYDSKSKKKNKSSDKIVFPK